LELNANFSVGHGVLGMAYTGKAMYTEAISAFQKVVSLRPGPEVGLGVAYARAGQINDARTVAADLERANNPMGAAVVYGLLGDRDLAFRLLEAAYEERDSKIPWIQSDPNLRTLSDDPRFGDLLRRMNLPWLRLDSKSGSPR